MKLKSKIRLALFFLFLIILCFGVSGIFFTKKLSSDADKILKNNYETLVFDNNMLKNIDALSTDKNAEADFADNLAKQEKNITEPGEQDATNNLRKAFDGLKTKTNDSANLAQIRHSIEIINGLNQSAILRKSERAHSISEDATVWLTSVFVIIILIVFTFVVNFPGAVANPIQALSEGITEIANKNYSKRIYLEQEDEFGDLATAFNTMAEKLDEYENSNLAQLKFEKSRIETIINQMKDGIVGLDRRKIYCF